MPIKNITDKESIGEYIRTLGSS